MSQGLEEIRRKIDALDDNIHDLLMERAALVSSVAAEKRKNNLQVVQPAREAKMIRRLLARHSGKLPEATIVRIWRELVGSVSLLQTGLKVAVACPEGAHTPFWDMARNYFGSVLPMTRAASALAAYGAVREGSSSFAVLPWPDDTDPSPWWPFLLNREGKALQVVCVLPYGRGRNQSCRNQDKALVVSKIDFMPSGADCSFIGIELDDTVSRARLIGGFKELGVEPMSVFTRSGPDTGGRSMHLFEVPGYIGEGDALLKTLEDKFAPSRARCMALGGYPVPPEFGDFEIQELIRREQVGGIKPA